jgi:acyl dehydratase
MKAGDIAFDAQVSGTSRDLIALFSQATEDPNPIHVDDAFAKACGFPQVLQQGPMTTAHFARLLADRFGPAAVQMLDVSFVAPVFPMESLRLTATVKEVQEASVTLDLQASKVDGSVTARGSAQVRVS